MAVQPVQEKQSSGIMFPAAATAVGAGVGYYAAPAKYGSFEDLIAEAEKGDLFKKTVEGDAKTVQQAAEKAFDGYKADIKALEGDGLFKAAADGKVPESVEASKVLEKLGVKTSTDAQKAAAKVAENIDKVAGKTISEDLAKEVLGKDAKLDDLKTAMAGLVGEDGKAIADKVAEAKKVVADAKLGDDFLAAAKEGKVTKEAAEGLAKAKAAATTGLEKFAEHTKGLFGKNVGKGLAWGAGIGLVVGLACKLFSGKKEAA